MKTGKKAGRFGPGKTPKDDYYAFDPGSVSGGGGVNKPKKKKKASKGTKK